MLNLSKKFLKNYFKQNFTKKKYIFISNFFFNSLYYEIENNPKKNRKWLYRRLSTKRLIYNYRNFSDYFSFFKVKKLKKLDPLFFVFKKYSYFFIVSQNYFNLTDFHLELFRRFLRKKLGKKVYIFCNIKPNFQILKRPSQIRMGGGKGSKVSNLIFPLYPGCIFFKIKGCSYKYITLAIKKLKKKMPFSFKLINASRL